MKVLLLTTHLNRGGMAVYTVNVAVYLKKAGVNVTVLSAGGDLSGRLVSEGIPHVTMNMKTKAEFGFKMWRALPPLVRLIEEEGFHIVHAQTRLTQVLSFLAGKISGVPFVSTCHGFFNERRLFRRILPCWGTKTIAISKSVQAHLINDFNIPLSQVSLIYNGIELDRYKSAGASKDSELMRSLGLAEDKMVVGTVGRLSPVKGYKYLISAFKDIISERDDVQLLIVGEGPEKGALEDQIRDMGMSKDVFLTPGKVLIGKYLALMDIFCLPSLCEGLGLSLMEAMAAGRTCVASNVGGLAELIINDKDGILVSPEDAKSLGTVMSSLLKDGRLRERLAKNAREKAMANFSIENSVAKTIRVYDDAITDQSGRSYG